MNISKLWLQVAFYWNLTFNGINQQIEFYIYAKMYLLISFYNPCPQSWTNNSSKKVIFLNYENYFK
jgi:hypothetical protein